MDEQVTGWTVYVTWKPIPGLGPQETSQTYPDWPAARRAGRQLVCKRGVRDVTVLDPHQVVAADWEPYIRRWREYRLWIGPCGNEREPDGLRCDGQLHAREHDQQVRCPRCEAWSGTRAPGMALVFDSPYPATA